MSPGPFFRFFPPASCTGHGRNMLPRRLPRPGAFIFRNPGPIGLGASETAPANNTEKPRPMPPAAVRRTGQGLSIGIFPCRADDRNPHAIGQTKTEPAEQHADRLDEPLFLIILVPEWPGSDARFVQELSGLRPRRALSCGRPGERERMEEDALPVRTTSMTEHMENDKEERKWKVLRSEYLFRRRG